MFAVDRTLPGVSRHELPRWLWLALPPALYLAHYLFALALAPATYDSWFTSELGLTEEGTVLFLAIALVAAAAVARRFVAQGEYGLAAWFALMALGCLYFAGEEASWGQHWFGWNTPGGWIDVNEQAETNLHNTHGWLRDLLDRLPRNLLTLGALVAGILPLWQRARSRVPAAHTRAYWLLPTVVCVPSGLVAALATIPQKLQEAWYGTMPLDIQAGEVKELLLAFFLLVYALSALRRLRQARPA